MALRYWFVITEQTCSKCLATNRRAALECGDIYLLSLHDMQGEGVGEFSLERPKAATPGTGPQTSSTLKGSQNLPINLSLAPLPGCSLLRATFCRLQIGDTAGWIQEAAELLALKKARASLRRLLRILKAALAI